MPPAFQPGPAYPGGPYSGAGQFGAYPPGGSGGNNRVILAVTAVTVLALVVGGIVFATTRSGDPSATPTAGLTGVTGPVSAPSSTDRRPAQSTSATTASPSPTSPSPTSPSSTSAAPTQLPTDQNLCIENDASTNLIHLTVTLGYATSYAQADEFDRRVIKSCVTPAAIKQLGPYYGKSFGLPGGDLSGNSGSGPTARYSVQLVNTSRYVTFTLSRKSGTSGYRIVSITG